MSLVCSPYTIYRPDIPSPHGAQVVLWSGGAGGATDRDNLTWIVLRTSSSAGEMTRLIKEWRDATRFLSNVSKKISHPIYNQIIAHGNLVVPSLLRDLKDNGPADWFWALTKITGENPITENMAGNMAEMTGAWLEWGRKTGHLND